MAIQSPGWLVRKSWTSIFCRGNGTGSVPENKKRVCRDGIWGSTSTTNPQKERPNKICYCLITT